MKAALVIMAAGIGSRFGGGIKQLEPVGPEGESIIDYSIYDAQRAGFQKLIFIIRKDLEKDFRERVGKRAEQRMEVEYAFQELSDLPKGYALPPGRKKPWGTGQAVLSVYGRVQEPFLVINADDYYGPESYRKLYEYMERSMTPDGLKLCMAGFLLKNTLSENGAVTRGICQATEELCLSRVEETYNIRLEKDKLLASDEAGAPVQVFPDQYASMNMWGLTPRFLEELKEGFPAFLSENIQKEKSEYLLPAVIDRCIRSGRGEVKILPTADRWFGVTYREDKAAVVAALQTLIREGRYPERLYG